MVSKNGCNALTGVQQKIFDTDRPEDDIIISAVHPGEVTTDMNPDHGTIMPDQSIIVSIILILRENNLTFFLF